MLAEGEAFRKRHNITSLPVYTRGIYSDLPPPAEPNGNVAKLDNGNGAKVDNGNGNMVKVDHGNSKPVSLNSILNSKCHYSKVSVIVGH